MSERKEARKKMDQSLKDMVVTQLRKRGFKGSYPHYRRIKDHQVETLSFQFSFFGPEFTVNVSVFPMEYIHSKQLNISKLNTLMGSQHRIGSIDGSDPWFSFIPTPLNPWQTPEGIDEHIRMNPQKASELLKQKPYHLKLAEIHLKDFETTKNLGEKIYEFRAEHILESLEEAEAFWQNPDQEFWWNKLREKRKMLGSIE